MTNGWTDEISQSISKQRQSDRKNPDLNNKITTLQLNFKNMKK